MSKVEQSAVSITADQLKEIIATAIAAAKAPNVVEQAKLDEIQKRDKEAQQNRVEGAEQQRQVLAAKAFNQKVCTHEHADGKGRTVFVQDDIGGYILCQKCQAVIRPENQLGFFPQNIQSSRSDITFNTPLFNTHFQKTNTSGVFA
jgi:hypothetical protein